MKKIAIFQYDLKVGGIQKSLINLLKNIDYKKYKIDLYIFDRDMFFEDSILKKVNLIYLNKFNIFYKYMPFNILQKLIKINMDEQYDLSIDYNSYQAECAIYALKVNSKRKFIFCHNDVEKKYKDEFKYRILWNLFYKKYYLFNKIIAVSNGAKESIVKKLGINNKIVEVIPNMIDTDEIILKSREKVDFDVNPKNYNLVTMGRFCHQKGFDILINIMDEVFSRRKNIKLYLIGDGPEYLRIKKMVEDKKIEDKVCFLGKQKNPFPYLNKMDGFILTSRYEGQGMVLLEAKCLGLNVIIPKHLEKYIDDIEGIDDITSYLLKVKKLAKRQDKLIKYNNEIIKKFNGLIEVE